MADARALLKARRQEARISHPLATYNTAGQLRCTVCGTPVKHASAWEGHLGSKAHRTNVLRLKEEERRREEEERRRQEEEMQEDEPAPTSGKRKAAGANGAGGKKQKLVDGYDEDEDEEEEGHGVGVLGQGGAFPTDFFSDPSRAPPPREYSDDEDEEVAPASKPKTAIDDEWEQFQKFIGEQPAPDAREASHDVFQQATIMAEPVITAAEEGMPNQAGEPAAEEMQEEDEETVRKRKERDERELIMDRLRDEEQAQEEADMRAQSLKDRLAALKKKRETARLAKAQKSS